jgi:CheY-like chemotaxis protein
VVASREKFLGTAKDNVKMIKDSFTLLKDKRIFITEDNVVNRSVMQLILETEGAVIAFERWGTETEKRLRDFAPIDLIILDLMLPGEISGLDVFDNIRAIPEFTAIPIIAVSAKETDIAITETRAKGFNGFIGKPINRFKFAKQIAAVMNGESLWET